MRVLYDGDSLVLTSLLRVLFGMVVAGHMLVNSNQLRFLRLLPAVCLVEYITFHVK